jgi:hypothetical protein
LSVGRAAPSSGVLPAYEHYRPVAACCAAGATRQTLDGKSVDWLEQVSDEQYQPDEALLRHAGYTPCRRTPMLAIILVMISEIGGRAACACCTARDVPHRRAPEYY